MTTLPPANQRAEISAAAAAGAAATVGSVDIKKQLRQGQTYGRAISVLETTVRGRNGHPQPS